MQPRKTILKETAQTLLRRELIGHVIDKVHNGNTSIGYGPTAIRSQSKIKNADQNVLVSNLCRTVYFIRGQVDGKNAEISSVI